MLRVDPDFVGHDSTARFDHHDSTERLPSLTQRSMKLRNHERRLEMVSNISPTFIREIARKLREQCFKRNDFEVTKMEEILLYFTGR